MPEQSRFRLAELTKDEFAVAIQEGRWVLLPFGTVEAHGPHLPLATDMLQAEHICAAVATRISGLVAPPLPHGVCRTFRNFPGTISLTPATPLLAHGVTSLRGYTGVGLGTGFRQLLTRTRIRMPEGRWPRIHDLRHTFAVHALARWYRTGADVHAKLPLLATYMGHVSIVSTAYYLPFVEPLRALATARFARHCGALLQASGPMRERSR